MGVDEYYMMNTKVMHYLKAINLKNMFKMLLSQLPKRTNIFFFICILFINSNDEFLMKCYWQGKFKVNETFKDNFLFMVCKQQTKNKLIIRKIIFVLKFFL